MQEIDAAEYFKINTHQTVKLAERAKQQGVQHFIFISSTKVYGDEGGNMVYDEETICKPTDPYGESKLEAENKLRAMASDKFKVACVRPPLVYGPGVKGNLFRLMKLAQRGYYLPFKGVQNNRAMVHVDNLIALIMTIIVQKADGIFCLTDEDVSTERLMRAILHALNEPIRLFNVTAPGRSVIKILRPDLYSRLYPAHEMKTP